MKFLLVSNGDLAGELYRAMKRFYASPDIDFMRFDDGFSNRLADYLRDTKEEILIACDIFGSAAFNETAYLLHKLNCLERAGIICGMNLPMIFKLYGLKDAWDIKSIKSLYREGEFLKADMVVY